MVRNSLDWKSSGSYCGRAAVLMLIACLANLAAAQSPAPVSIGQLLTVPATSGIWNMQIETQSGRLAMMRISNNFPDLASPLPYVYDKSAMLREASRKLANLDLLRKRVAVLEGALRRDKPAFFPEYGNTLREVALTLDQGDLLASAPLQRHLPVLKALPEYTNILLLVPTPLIEAVQAQLQQENLALRTILIPVQTQVSAHGATATPTESSARWIRDGMLVSKLGGSSVIYAPIAYKQMSDISVSETAFLYELAFSRRIVLPLPLFIRGGNFTIAESDAIKYGFIGENEILLNESAFLQSFGFKPPRHAFLEVLRVLSGVDEVVVLPNTPNFHQIDLALVALGNMNVGVIDSLDPLAEADAIALARIRATLTDLGFTVAPIPSSAARIEAFRSSVNGIAFVDLSHQQHTILLPLFPDETFTANGAATDLNTLIREAYGKLGYRTVWIDDRVDNLKGSIRSILNELD